MYIFKLKLMRRNYYIMCKIKKPYLINKNMYINKFRNN